ncbi:hypothetical protein V6N11_075497 [Hibiscus sabdariffa]|uniref:Uncharacterized protein n=1 Tax=Hibiscus sabdariffa TaxID=183260 RepID=A0ABR2R6N9_9ROSI
MLASSFDFVPAQESGNVSSFDFVPAQESSHSSVNSLSQDSVTPWILDSGATDHVACSLSCVVLPICEGFGVTEDVLKRNNGSRMTKRNPVNVFPNIVVSDSVQSGLQDSLPAHEQAASTHVQSSSTHEQISQEQNFQTASSSTHEQIPHEQNFQKALQIALPTRPQRHKHLPQRFKDYHVSLPVKRTSPHNINQATRVLMLFHSSFLQSL